MTTQALMPFEAEAVAAEAAKCEAQRAAERHEREAKEAARALAKIARDKAKAEEEMAKAARRREREHKAKMKAPAEHAQCGIRWYSRSLADIARGSYWRTCHACGQPLIYTSDPSAKPQECKGHR
jgi:hypothetical protein